MKAVIFDFNGTMVFDTYYHDLAWKVFSKQIRGFEMSEEEMSRNVHGKVNEKIIEYLKPDVSKEENERLSLEKEALYRKLCREDKEHYKLVKGLKSFMNELKSNQIPFTIASASIKENIEFFIETFHLDNWIDPALIVYDDGTYENKVEMFLEAAKRMNVKIDNCIVFEDSFSGIRYANAAGVKTIVAIPPKAHQEEYDNNAIVTYTIQDFEDKRLKEITNDKNNFI